MGWSNDIPNPFIVGGGGVSGEIILYNAADEIIGILNENGILVQDPTTGTFVFITPDPVDGAEIVFGPPLVPGHTFTNAPIFTSNLGGPNYAPFISCISPTIDGNAAAQWALIGDDGALGSVFVVFADELQSQANITCVDIPNGTSAISIGRGARATLGSNSSSASVADETVVATLNNFIWRAGRAYKVEMGQRVESSTTSQRARFLMRRGTTIAGTLLVDFGTTETCSSTASADMNCYGTGWVINATGSDITQSVCVTLDNESSAVNTVTWLGSAASPRWLTITDVGSASDYSFAAQV